MAANPLIGACELCNKAGTADFCLECRSSHITCSSCYPLMADLGLAKRSGGGILGETVYKCPTTEIITAFVLMGK